MRPPEIPLANSLRPSETFASLRETSVRLGVLAGNQVSRRDAKVSKERRENSPTVLLDAALEFQFVHYD